MYRCPDTITPAKLGETPGRGETKMTDTDQAEADRLRVLVADDHPLFRTGVRAALETSDRIQVVGEASTGTEAVRAVRGLQPDIVLMDVQMPEMNGIEAIRSIRRDVPKTTVLVLTMFVDADTLLAAVRAGAQGYLFKGSSAQEIAVAIDAIGRGEVVFGAPLAEHVIDHIVRPPRENLPFPELTEREREVLERVANGNSNAQIAAGLSLSTKTVRNYMSRILVKLQVTDRTAAAVRARQAGFGR
jgi:DNA-binding NarL/FixJ family response regulator